VTREDCQALEGICECVPGRILGWRAGLVSAFVVQVSVLVFLPLRFSSGPLSPATGTSRRRREVKGKADFRDEPRALVIASLNRYNVTSVHVSRIAYHDDSLITSHPFAACLRRRSIRAWRCQPEHFSFGHNP